MSLIEKILFRYNTKELLEYIQKHINDLIIKDNQIGIFCKTIIEESLAKLCNCQPHIIRNIIQLWALYMMLYCENEQMLYSQAPLKVYEILSLYFYNIISKENITLAKFHITILHLLDHMNDPLETSMYITKK